MVDIDIEWEKEINNGIDYRSTEEQKSDCYNYPDFLVPQYQAWYQTGVECPECHSMPLYKIKVHDRTTFFKKEIRMFHMFTCPKCMRFYAGFGHVCEYALVSKKYNGNSGEDYRLKLYLGVTKMTGM